MDPLFLQAGGKVENCPFVPCPANSETCTGKIRPWTNLEYNYGNNHKFIVGQYFNGYGNKTMISLGANLLFNKKDYRGFSIDGQLGFLPINSYYTIFSNISYQRLNKQGISQVISPSISVAAPFKIVNSIQFEFGYDIGMYDPKLNGPFFGISTKLPLAYYF